MRMVVAISSIMVAWAPTPGAARQADMPAIGKPAAITGRDAKSRALYLALIENLRKSGQVHAALAHLDAFDRQFPRARDAAVLRGNCLVDLKQYEAASTVFQRLARSGEAAAAYAGLGRIEALNERWAGAAGNYALAVQRAPTSSAYLSDYGFVLLRAGRAGEAVFRLRQAVQLAPGDTRARNNLVLALAASGDEVEARRLLSTIPAAERAEIEAELSRVKSAAGAAG